MLFNYSDRASRCVCLAPLSTPMFSWENPAMDTLASPPGSVQFNSVFQRCFPLCNAVFFPISKSFFSQIKRGFFNETLTCVICRQSFRSLTDYMPGWTQGSLLGERDNLIFKQIGTWQALSHDITTEVLGCPGLDGQTGTLESGNTNL
jgi:hypothetical protein